MELLSVVLYLRALDYINDLQFTGHQTQGWLLGLIHQFDPSLAKKIHPPPNKDEKIEDGTDSLESNLDKRESDHAPNLNIIPYTVSGIMRGGVRPTQIASGDRCWLRFTTYDQALIQLFSGQLLPDIEEQKREKNLPVLHLGIYDFLIEGWTDDSSKHEWAGRASSQMIENWSLSHAEQSIHLDFTSPTHFRRNGLDIPVPVPWMVFRSYWRHWEKFSGAEGDSSVEDFIDSCIALSEAAIQTEVTCASEKSKRKSERGFIGQCKFSIIRNQKRNQKEKWNKADFEYYGKIIRMLAAFSFYCGTGHHTTVGLGQTRLI